MIAKKRKSRKPRASKNNGLARATAPRLAADGPVFLHEEKKFGKTKNSTSIVPKGSISGHALSFLIAIMSFLACLTVSSVTIVGDAVDQWKTDLGRELTIQILPAEGVDMLVAIEQVVGLAEATAGLGQIRAVSENEARLLVEPWLGDGAFLDDLPLPRLVIAEIVRPDELDLHQFSTALIAQVPTAQLDSHRIWVDRLKSMAGAVMIVGFGILTLVLAATVLTIVFATRAAMAGNRDTVEVLHFVGASNRFIASEFQRHFLLLGLKGSLTGGIIAVIVFYVLGIALQAADGSALSAQIDAFFGTIDPGLGTVFGSGAVVVLISILTSLTTRLTVYRTLTSLHLGGS
ncbi:MAG: ABC transporter permease [Cohaesibacteraceae bacterium]|nr:ABC transporter permease [Cohaesibacteraceae bacterium]